MKTNTPPVLITFALICLALVQNAQAVNPPPDGGYPGGNTAEGTSALLNLTAGTYNTAIGIYSLLSLTDGDFCTGVGAGTLLVNTADQNTATGAGALLSNTTGLWCAVPSLNYKKQLMSCKQPSRSSPSSSRSRPHKSRK